MSFISNNCFGAIHCLVSYPPVDFHQMRTALSTLQYIRLSQHACDGIPQRKQIQNKANTSFKVKSNKIK